MSFGHARGVEAVHCGMLVKIELGRGRDALIAAATIVGIKHNSITMALSFQRSDRYPVSRTTTTPTAPEGSPMISACWLVYPKVVRRMLLKLLRPPFGILVSRTLKATSQTRTSLMLSRIWSFLICAFCVPDWFSLTLRSAAIFSAGVKRAALHYQSTQSSKKVA